MKHIVIVHSLKTVKIFPIQRLLFGIIIDIIIVKQTKLERKIRMNKIESVKKGNLSRYDISFFVILFTLISMLVLGFIV
jgi:Na+-transporting methylmalonyl-CoA/oxaloacetate decarboxylase beta subunit